MTVQSRRMSLIEATTNVALCYARAAAWILGADRFVERMWRQLEKQAGVETRNVAPSDPAHGAGNEHKTEPQAGRITAPRRRGWKITTPRYME